MRTALDSNIISALWSQESVAKDLDERMVLAKQTGPLVISPIVYAELLAHPAVNEAFVERFLKETGIDIDFNLPKEVWREAGTRFAAYAKRRRKSSKTGPRRLAADFVIGAHAMLTTDRLMTLNRSDYRQDFPELLLM